MPQLIFFATLAAIAYFGYRKLIKTAEQTTDRLKKSRRERETGAMGTLEQDPDTGEYRIKRDE